MENFRLLLKSIRDHWVSLSSMFVPADMTFFIMCGVGLFILLIPFLKTYPESAPGSKRNTPKVVKRVWIKIRNKIAAVKGYRYGRKNVKETQNPSQPMEIPIKHPLLDSIPHLPWNPSEKMDELPLSQLLTCLRALEDLIQQKFSQIFWGMSSVISESVVATAWVSRNNPSVGPKSLMFNDRCGTFPALPLAQGLPRFPHANPFPHHLVAPSLLDVTERQELDNYPSSTPNQTLSSSQSSTCETEYPTTRTKIQASLSTESQPWKQDLNWKETIGSNVQKCQAAISQPSHNFSQNIQSTEAARSASILPEQFQFFHHQEPQNEDRATKMRKQRGAPFRFLPSREIKKLQGAFPAHRPHQSKNRPDLSHPAKSSILDSKRCKLSPHGSVPSRMPLKKGPAKCNMHDPIKVGLSVGAKDLPSTSSNTPSKNLEPRTPSLRTNQLSYVNTAQNLFFLDTKTQMKLESNIAHLPLKHCRPQTLELTGLTPPGVPASSLPQPVCPSSPACASKAEYYSKTAKILEKLHHQDPGGKDIEIISATRVQCPPFAHSRSEVQETQRAPLPAASHEMAKAHPDVKQRYLSTQTRAFSFQAKTQQGRTIRGTGRGSLQPTTSPRRAKHAPWKRFKNVASGHPCWSGTMAVPQERIPPSVTEQTSRFVVKDKTHPARKVSLEATEISNGQAINIGSRHSESAEANRSPCHFQTPTLQHLGDSALNPQVGNEIDFRSSKKPEAWLVVHHPDGPSLVYPATVNLPSQHLLPNPKTSHGLGDVFMRRDQSMETQEFRVTKDNMDKVFLPNEERESFMRSGNTCQGESLGRVRPPTSSSTQPDHTAMTDSQSSLDKAGKGRLPESYIKEITKNILKYLSRSTKDKGQGDSLKNESPPPSSVQTQEVVTKKQLLYTMVVEVQFLMNVVVQTLVNWLGINVRDPSKIQWSDIEPLASQLGRSSHSFMGLCDPKNSQPEKRMSGGLPSHEDHKHPFIYRGIRDKHQSGVNAQKTFAHHQYRAKRGTGFNQLPTPKENNHPCMYRVTGDKQEPDTATKSAHDQDLFRMKSAMGCYPHMSPKEHNHPIRYKEIGDKQQAGVVHRAYNPHQSRKRGMSCGHLTSPREKHPVM